MNAYRLSDRAKRRLEDIIGYTIEWFGRDQAERYRDLLLDRLASLAKSKLPHGRPCSVLVRGEAPEGLLYGKAGGHFVVYMKDDKGIIVVDIIHQTRDLPALIASLTADET